MEILYVCGHLIRILLGLSLHVILLPIMIPILLIFWIISRIVKLLLWLEYDEKTYKSKGMDALWGLETENARPIITILITLTGKPNVERVRKAISEKVLEVRDAPGRYRYRKLRQLFFRRYGYYVWQDAEDFHVNNHVTVLQLKEAVGNSDWTSQVLDYISVAENEALGKDRPPWHIKLLHSAPESGTSNGSFDKYSMVIFLHHAIADGVSLVRVLMDSMVDTPMPSPMSPKPLPNIFFRSILMMWSFAVLPLGMIRILLNSDKNSLHGPKLSGTKIVVWSQGLPLQLVRQVKTAAGATVNDVLMTCLAGAVAKYLDKRQESVVRISTVIPVRFPENEGITRLNNKFSCGVIKLYTKKSLTSKDRLTQIKKTFDGYKRDPALRAIYWTTAVVSDLIPAPLAEKFFSAKGVSLVASNIPGPQQKVVIYGDEVDDCIFWVPNRAPSGVGISLFSYNGVIKAGLNVDSALIPSKEEAASLLQEMESEVYVLQCELLAEAKKEEEQDESEEPEKPGKIHRVKVKF